MKSWPKQENMMNETCMGKHLKLLREMPGYKFHTTIAKINKHEEILTKMIGNNPASFVHSDVNQICTYMRNLNKGS